MSLNFKIPSSPARSNVTISNFLGVDFTNSPANVDENKSPNAVNMIRDVPGKVRKCMGYHTIKTYTGKKINGSHKLLGTANRLIHAGANFYSGDTSLYSTANDVISKSWQFNDKLYIIDGKALLVYDGSTVAPATSTAYIPTVTISKDPSGGGTQYEDLNLLQPGFIETFLGTASVTAYQLTFSGLDATAVKVEVMDSNGDFVTKTVTTDYTVDRTNGIINFLTAPGVSPLTGEDNVKITAYRTVSGYADRINKCSVGTLFGVNGAQDRLFLSGNPDFINYDWYSQQYDPGYFPDTGYSVMGSDRSAIVGYSIISNYLATHKDEMETDQSIILRQGDLVDNSPAFKIINTLQGAGSIAKHSFSYLSTEPLFLTRSGVYAVTAQDITGEKYAQNRSFFINGRLLDEENLENAVAFTFDDMYWLCINGVAYILDGLQPMQTDKSMPYATRQYAGFYRTNLPATSLWEDSGIMYFGTIDGKICECYKDPFSQLSYNDDGVAIEAYWETPDLDGQLFYKNKTFRFMAVRLQSAIATSLKIFVQKRGIWSFVKEESKKTRYFAFQYLVFPKLSFSNDTTQKIISTKLRVKKIDKARFRLLNDELNEPFGIFDIAFEFVESGNFKG